jgi:hypothetical protein
MNTLARGDDPTSLMKNRPHAGSTAIIPAGSTGSEQPTNAIDLFTIPSLTGELGRPSRGSASIMLTNTGTSALPGSFSVALYASADGTLGSAAVLLGSVRVRGPLAAGATDQVSVPILIPAKLPAGSCHPIAASGPPGQLVEFAAQRRLLTVGPVAAVVSTRSHGDSVFVPLALPQSAAFGDVSITGGSLVGAQGELLG